jgi:hypothetical protein
MQPSIQTTAVESFLTMSEIRIFPQPLLGVSLQMPAAIVDQMASPAKRSHSSTEPRCEVHEQEGNTSCLLLSEVELHGPQQAALSIIWRGSPK